MFKILRTITWLPVGGIERRLTKVLPLLNLDPFEISVCCLREKGPLAEDLEKNGLKVNLIHFKKRLDPSAILHLSKFIRESKFHIIHSHMYRSNVPTTIAARIAKAPIIISQIHNVNTWETKRQLLMDRFLCRFRDGIIAVSEEVKRNIVEKLKIDENFCKVIYNGIDLKEFENVSRSKKIFGEFGIQEDDIVIVMTARLLEVKNPNLAIRVFKRISEEISKCHLVFAGDGALRNNLEKFTKDLNLQNKIHFLGMRNDVPQIVSASDIFILPSMREGFSNAILEAMACGVPSIVSDVGGNREAIRDERDGFLIPAGDEEMLYKKIMLLIKNSDLRKKMGEQARERVKEFSINKMVDNLREYYFSLLKKKKLL